MKFNFLHDDHVLIVITRFVFERSQFPLKGSFPATRPVADDSHCIGGVKVRVEDGRSVDYEYDGQGEGRGWSR